MFASFSNGLELINIVSKENSARQSGGNFYFEYECHNLLLNSLIITNNKAE